MRQLQQQCQRSRKTAVAIKGAGGDAFALPADVARMPEVTRMFDEAIAHFGRLDILLNNAECRNHVWPNGQRHNQDGIRPHIQRQLQGHVFRLPTGGHTLG